MRVIHVNKSIKQNWSGGTTTELFRVPSDHDNLKFDIRISMAEINDSPSNFTPLEGIQRTLVLLEGELELTHKGKTESLRHLDHSKFSGDWTTQSIGRARVLNIMTPASLQYIHQLKTISLTNRETSVHKSKNILDALYIVNGSLSINSEIFYKDTLIVLEQGEALQLKACSNLTILGISIL